LIIKNTKKKMQDKKDTQQGGGGTAFKATNTMFSFSASSKGMMAVGRPAKKKTQGVGRLHVHLGRKATKLLNSVQGKHTKNQKMRACVRACVRGKLFVVQSGV